LWAHLKISKGQQQSAEEKKEKEPRTGLLVPVQVLGQPLVATSARSVTFLGFLTYAFALYRDASKWSANDVDAVIPGIISDPSGTTFRITTYRDIDCTHFCSSINSGAVPRMKKTLESSNVESTKAHEQAEAIGQVFRSVFKTKDLPANTAVDFVISRLNPKSNETRVTIYINGTQEGHVDGSLFTNALVAMYFGTDPRSNEIQSGIKNYLKNLSTASKSS
jgi:hypothetical protein